MCPLFGVFFAFGSVIFFFLFIALDAVRNMRLSILEDTLRATWDPPYLQTACITTYGIVMWDQHSTTINYDEPNTSTDFTPTVACMTYYVLVKAKIGQREGVPTTEQTTITASGKDSRNMNYLAINLR